jgi:RimJ/RimL family protein N-acetyltransferase
MQALMEAHLFEATPPDCIVLPELILRPVDDSKGDLELIHEWVKLPKINRWLDFGAGLQDVGLSQLSFVLKNPSNCPLLYCDGRSGQPVGLMVLSNIKNRFKVASLWGLRGELRVGVRKITQAAIIATLFKAFHQMGINAVTAWAVEGNAHSIAALRRVGFLQTGTQSACHFLEDKCVGRVHFEILADAFHELYPRTNYGFRDSSISQSEAFPKPLNQP